MRRNGDSSINGCCHRMRVITYPTCTYIYSVIARYFWNTLHISFLVVPFCQVGCAPVAASVRGVDVMQSPSSQDLLMALFDLAGTPNEYG